MESQVHFKRVGFFLVFMFFLMLIGIFWIGRFVSSHKGDNYIVIFEKQSLDGLQKDSAVTMKGIKVGTVSSYKISEENIQRVRVTIELDTETPVKIDTKAVLRRNLLTGLAKIDLVGGTQDAPLLNKIEQNESYPIINEELTQLEKIADSVPEILLKIEETIIRINSLFNKNNVDNLSSTLESLRVFSGEISKVSPNISKSIKSFETTSEKLSVLLEKLSGNKTNNDGVVGEVQILIQDLNKVTNSLSQLISSVEPNIRSVSRSTVSIEKDLEQISRSITTLSDRYSEPNDLFQKNDNSK